MYSTIYADVGGLLGGPKKTKNMLLKYLNGPIANQIIIRYAKSNFQTLVGSCTKCPFDR